MGMAPLFMCSSELAKARFCFVFPQALRIFWETKNAAAALEIQPGRHSQQRTILEGIRDHGVANVWTATARLPKNLRSMCAENKKIGLCLIFSNKTKKKGVEQTQKLETDPRSVSSPRLRPLIERTHA